MLGVVCKELFTTPLAKLMLQWGQWDQSGLSVKPGFRSYTHEFSDSKG